MNDKIYKISADNIKKIINSSGSCIASDKITVEGLKVGYMYRENPTNETDTGWRFFAGDESEEYTNNANNFEIYDLNTICNYDETIIPYLISEIGTSFEKVDNEFKKIN